MGHAKTVQIGIRIPAHLHKVLEQERNKMIAEEGKTSMTDVVVKYLYLGLEIDPSQMETSVESIRPLGSTLERLTDVLERLEQKIN